MQNGLWSACATTASDYNAVAVKTSAAIVNAGHALEALYRRWAADQRAAEACEHDDPFLPGQYYESGVHPYETMFVPTGPDAEVPMLAKLTQWTVLAKYSSEATCSSS